MRDEIESITHEANLRLLQDVMCFQQSSPVLLVVSDVVNHSLKLVAESTGSKAARPNMTEIAQSYHTSLAYWSGAFGQLLKIVSRLQHWEKTLRSQGPISVAGW